jgi:CRISPR-associated protein Cmr6
MSIPLYKDSATSASRVVVPGKASSINTGLWFTRFYNAFGSDWTVEAGGKRGWIDATVKLGSSGDAVQLRSIDERQQRLCKAIGGLTTTLETDGPFVTGMGLSHPVENGFTFHPTFGTPYLPASGVKGLLRGWVEAWMELDSSERSDLIGRWFGASAGNEEDMPEVAGNLIFFDALPIKPVDLGCEVMTPHMGSWYEKGQDITSRDYAAVTPADWHSPVPVPFLVVRSGTAFRFMIAPRLTGNETHDVQTKLDLVQAMQELKNALEWLGAGAKTATGFGRMIDRIAEKARNTAAALDKADIASGNERWLNAQLSWSKGKQSLAVANGAGKSVSQTGTQAKALLMSLSETSRTRLDKGKVVLAHTTVRLLGNQITLISIEEP